MRGGGDKCLNIWGGGGGVGILFVYDFTILIIGDGSYNLIILNALCFLI